VTSKDNFGKIEKERKERKGKNWKLNGAVKNRIFYATENSFFVSHLRLFNSVR
jgi:hypothetical protein